MPVPLPRYEATMSLLTHPTTRQHRARRARRRPRRPVVLLAGGLVALALFGGAGAVLAAPAPPPAGADNPNCTLLVPAQPLTAAGLATPYRLVATDRRAGACHEANADQAPFVEAAILDPATRRGRGFPPPGTDPGPRPPPPPVATVPANPP